MTASPFETSQRQAARLAYESGDLRAALHLWDSLEYPELLDDEEVVMFETARREVSGSG